MATMVSMERGLLHLHILQHDPPLGVNTAITGPSVDPQRRKISDRGQLGRHVPRHSWWTLP